MAKRGRWSTEDQRAMPGVVAEPPPPPRELEKSERVIWRSLVAQLPPNWFVPGSQSLLEQLCRHTRYCNELARDITAIRQALDEMKVESALVRRRSEKDSAVAREYQNLFRVRAALTKEYRDLLHAHAQQSTRVSSLSVKLRLTVQAKVAVSAAAKKARDDTPKGIDPWLDWDNNATTTEVKQYTTTTETKN
jgi:hypothetical protein